MNGTFSGVLAQTGGVRDWITTEYDVPHEMLGGCIRLTMSTQYKSTIYSAKTINFSPFKTIRVTFNTMGIGRNEYCRLRVATTTHGSGESGSGTGSFDVSTNQIDYDGQHVFNCDVGGTEGHLFLKMYATTNNLSRHYLDIAKIEFLT